MTLFTLIGGLIIFIYCLYAVFNIDDLIKRYYVSTMKLYDVFSIGVTSCWIVVEFFLKPGPVVLIPVIMLTLNLNSKNEKKARILHTIMFTLLALTVAFIIVNEFTYKLNFWKV